MQWCSVEISAALLGISGQRSIREKHAWLWKAHHMNIEILEFWPPQHKGKHRVKASFSQGILTTTQEVSYCAIYTWSVLNQGASGSLSQIFRESSKAASHWSLSSRTMKRKTVIPSPMEVCIMNMTYETTDDEQQNLPMPGFLASSLTIYKASSFSTPLRAMTPLWSFPGKIDRSLPEVPAQWSQSRPCGNSADEIPRF